jgi:PDZ domain
MLNSLDPYTEFEGVQEARDMSESIEGRYGGVGLVIAGIPASSSPPPSSTAQSSSNAEILPNEAKQGDEEPLNEGGSTISTAPTPTVSSTGVNAALLDDDDEEDDYGLTAKQRLRIQKSQDRGIRVVSAFEGYAFDFGMRVGDRLIRVDDTAIGPGSSVEQVRNSLRGQPGTLVTIQFERDGVEGVQSVTMPRQVVKVRCLLAICSKVLCRVLSNLFCSHLLCNLNRFVT